MHLHQVYMVEPISTCEEIRFRPENRCFTTSILGGPWVGPCYHQFLEVILLLVALLSHPTIKWVWLPELLWSLCREKRLGMRWSGSSLVPLHRDISPFILQRHFLSDGLHIGDITFMRFKSKFVTYQPCFGAPFTRTTHPPCPSKTPPSFLRRPRSDSMMCRLCFPATLAEREKIANTFWKDGLRILQALKFQMDSR